jgi:hypothetical protein
MALEQSPQHPKRVQALLMGGGDVAANCQERPRAGQRALGAGDLLLQRDHAKISPGRQRPCAGDRRGGRLHATYRPFAGHQSQPGLAGAVGADEPEQLRLTDREGHLVVKRKDVA